MAAMPEETKQKISAGVKQALQSPAVQRRRSEGLKRSWTPARRAALGRERREFWRRWREAKAAREAGVEQSVVT